MKKLIFFLFNLLIAGILSAQTLPPLPATSGSSSAGSGNMMCSKSQPILDNKSVSIDINNLHPNSPIGIVDIEVEPMYLAPNPITSIQIDNNGSVFGYPKWNYGPHEINISFANKVRSIKPDGTFILYVTITYKTDRSGHPKYYERKVCIKDPTIPATGAGKKYGQNSDSFEFEMPKMKEHFDAHILGTFDPSLIINVENTEVPVSIYAIGLSNPSYVNTIQQDKFLSLGEHKIKLEEFPKGIYQLVVQQGTEIHRLKFVSVD